MCITKPPMMFESELIKMYHAWLQGQQDYVPDYKKFVEWAAMWNKVTYEIMMEELSQYKWFKHD
jgi:hypothetical protein